MKKMLVIKGDRMSIEDYSYVAKLFSCVYTGTLHPLLGYKRQLWQWKLIGTNGKEVMRSKWYSKRSYALYQAKSFVNKTNGVRLDV